MLCVFIFFHGTTAPSAPGPPHYRGFTFILRHTTVSRTPLYEWSARRRDLYLTKKKKTTLSRDIKTTGGVRNRNPRKRKAACPRLRQGSTSNGQVIRNIIIIFLVARPSDSGSWPSLKGLQDHTELDITLGRTPSRRVISPKQTPLTTNNTHKRQTPMASGGNRTHNFRKRTAANPPLRPRRQYITFIIVQNRVLQPYKNGSPKDKLQKSDT